MRDKNRTNHRGGALRRTAAAASLTLLVGALPVALATPASATQTDCQKYLAGYGYNVGKGVKRACALGSIQDPVGDGMCWQNLRELGVKSRHASTACALA